MTAWLWFSRLTARLTASLLIPKTANMDTKTRGWATGQRPRVVFAPGEVVPARTAAWRDRRPGAPAVVLEEQPAEAVADREEDQDDQRAAAGDDRHRPDHRRAAAVLA